MSIRVGFFMNEARANGETVIYSMLAFSTHRTRPCTRCPEDYDKYRGPLRRGWDVIRDARIRQTKTIGLVNPDELTPSRRPAGTVRAWDQLVPLGNVTTKINRMVTLRGD